MPCRSPGPNRCRWGQRDRQPSKHSALVGDKVLPAPIVRLPNDKQSLGSRHEALAVDLESFAVAEVCHRRGVRFLGVRIITDAMDEQLPVDIQNLTDQPTAASRLGAAFGAVCRRPSSVKDMLQLKENALVGSDRLAHFLDGMIRQLTPLDGVHGDGL